MYKFNFEKLEVWQKARKLTKTIYQETRGFPDEEKFGLTNQIRRAAVSVCSNIAEGASRISEKDQKHFYVVAYSSLMELINQVIISTDLQYIDDNTTSEFRKEFELISYMLLRLRDSRS